MRCADRVKAGWRRTRSVQRMHSGGSAAPATTTALPRSMASAPAPTTPPLTGVPAAARRASSSLIMLVLC
ncbi:MAG TPA: hypothetical protein VNK05_05335 [Chloroflexota bacterium]|nr:hypothetical protein [Chloroflexota bacterium]